MMIPNFEQPVRASLEGELHLLCHSADDNATASSFIKALFLERR
jgi:hypothetical protein